MMMSLEEPRAGRMDDPQPLPSTADFRVALICMPFAAADRPSIQVGLIHALAQRAGFETDAYYFSLDLAAQLSPKVYDKLSEHRGHMTGEWLFAPAAFGLSPPGDEEDYFQAFPGEAEWLKGLGMERPSVVDLRCHLLPLFIESCLAAVDWAHYRVVGFSSTFQQNVASLALARRIAERYPGVTIVFGGANMEGEMGQECARAFPFINYVVSGEGDLAFPALLRSLSTGAGPEQVSGVVVRRPNGLTAGRQADPFSNLDALPVPAYGPYFDRAIQLGLLPHYKTVWTLPFESSRGCWWGQKHHCTFCGLNGLGMAYRGKSPQRVLSELAELACQHRITSFLAVDNILDPKYMQRFFAPIQESKLDYQFFYEIKANLTRAQIQAMYRGGVRSAQPGIESMSSHVLQLMRKGCTMLQNVLILKWFLYYNIHAGWNLIWGFPGETEADCQKELEVLKCISHMEPPRGCGRIWLERFSPHYADRAAFPVFNVRPEASYRFVYPDGVNLEKLAYFFDYDMGDTVPAETHRVTEDYVSQWQISWHSDQRHTLTYRRSSDGLLIDYNWGAEARGTYSLFGPLALIYESCVETMHTARYVQEHLHNCPEAYDFSVEEIRDTLEEFCRGRLMLNEEGRYLSLAIPSNPNW
jgi:ribosomal peptide maturation radical SAM protein 1